MSSSSAAIVVVKSKSVKNVKVLFPKEFGSIVKWILEDSESEEKLHEQQSQTRNTNSASVTMQ